MSWSEFCENKAEEAELLAADTPAPSLRREWLLTASLWRVAASETAPPNSPASLREGGQAAE